MRCAATRRLYGPGTLHAMNETPDPDGELAELLRRRALTEDAARPDAVATRHERGGRTARENVADLDRSRGRGSSTGASRSPPQRGAARSRTSSRARRPTGCIAGTARIDGVPCAVLSYDYTVLAGTQGAVGHAKKDRLFELIERMRLPAVFFAEGGGGRPGDTDYPGGLGAAHARVRAVGAAVGEGAADRDRQGPLLRRQRGDRRVLGPHRRDRGRVARHGRAGDDRRRRARRRRPRRRRPDVDAGAERRRRRRGGRRGRGGRGQPRLLRVLPRAGRRLDGARPGRAAHACCPRARGARTTSSR